MIQIISILFTIALIAFILHKFKEPLSLRKMTLTAIFLSIALVLTLYSINLMVFGGQVVVRFSQLALIILGASLGPVYGLMGSLGFDILNLMIFPLGSFYFGFTLTNIMVSLLPALVFQFLKKHKESFNLSVLIFTGLAYIVYIISVLALSMVSISTEDLSAKTISINVMVFVIIFLIVFILAFLFIKKKGIKLNNDLIMFITSAILVEFIVQGFLTPLWLHDMYQTPIIISMQIRAIKGLLMVALNSSMGYPIYKLTKKLLVK